MTYNSSPLARRAAALMILCAATSAHAQASRSLEVAQPCNQVARPEQADRAMQMLASTNASVRERLGSIGVRPQLATAPRGVLRSTPACARLRASLRKAIRESDTPPEGLRQAPLSFLELGDYYGVIVTSGSKPANGLRRAGVAPLYSFDRSTMNYVARLAL